MTTAIAEQGTQLRSLRAFMESKTVKEQIKNALPQGLTAERAIRQLLTLAQRTPRLLDCTQLSLGTCLLQACELGLELSTVLGEAYLVPRFSKRDQAWEATFQVGYRGLCKLAYRSGHVRSIEARAVKKEDRFSVACGSDPRIVHVPMITIDGGQVIAYYAIAKLCQGGEIFEVMSHSDVERHRAKYSPPSDRGPSAWDTSFDEMAIKTVVRRLCKRLPSSVEMAKLAEIEEVQSLEFDEHRAYRLPEQIADARPAQAERIADRVEAVANHESEQMDG